MSQLFKHAAIFSDIHFGLRNNSKLHNDDCSEFIDWFIKEATARGCETCIFCGDWHHNRSSVNVTTLNYSVKNLKKLSEAFENVYMVVGNHDIFHREKRDLTSFPYADLYDNIHVISEKTTEIGDVSFVPWLVGDEWMAMEKLSTKYVFGHFELPRFMMNAIVEMPDHGELQVEHFRKPDFVFSGHFHKRQLRDKVHYVGSPFAHNYADSWDDERGAGFLKWDEEPVYVNWDGPRYIHIKLSELIDNPEVLNDKTYCKAVLDIPISYEESNFIKETFVEQYSPRELKLVPVRKDEHSAEIKTNEDIEIESVDQVVYSQLGAVESETMDKKVLMDIYKHL